MTIPKEITDKCKYAIREPVSGNPCSGASMGGCPLYRNINFIPEQGCINGYKYFERLENNPTELKNAQITLKWAPIEAARLHRTQ